MNELLEKQRALEVLKLRTQAKCVSPELSKVTTDAKALLFDIEADLLNIRADILEATPINTSFSKLWDKFPDNFDEIFDSFKDK